MKSKGHPPDYTRGLDRGYDMGLVQALDLLATSEILSGDRNGGVRAALVILIKDPVLKATWRKNLGLSHEDT